MSATRRRATEIARAHVPAPLTAPAGAFPIVRAIVAELRAAGLDPKLTYAREGGLEIGRRDTRKWVPVSLAHSKGKKTRA